MKLATLKQGGRDGRLVVVSDDLAHAVTVPDIAITLQEALEDWSACSPRLEAVFQQLNAGEMAAAFSFDETQAHSPLPRAYQWSEGSVFIVHLERCRGATNRELPASLYTEIGMYQGGSDNFVPPRSPMLCEDEEWDPDLEAGVCVITDDVPMGTSAEDAARHIRLLVLVNDFSLRRLQPAEMAKGLGVLQCKPANAFSPVAVSPDTLGSLWTGSMLAAPISVSVRGERLGEPLAHVDALFEFPQLIAHLARTRALQAGTIIGAGTVANRDPTRGEGCILERRAKEIIATGSPQTPFLSFGDRIRIESFGPDGRSIFGAIDQSLERYAPPTAPS